MGTLGSSLSRSATIGALDISAVLLFIFGTVLVIGLIGEHKTDEKHTERQKVWYKRFELMVIIGVAGELFADGGLFVFSQHLGTIDGFEIARLNHETAKLEAIAAGRNLKPEEIQALALALRPFATQPILIGSYTGDLEGARLAMQIKSALDRARLTVENRIGDTEAEPGGAFFGVSVTGEVGQKDMIFAISDTLASKAHLL
jgi:hypothetical protein